MTALDDWPWLRSLWDRKNGGAISGAVRPASDLRQLHARSGGLCVHCGKLTELTVVRHDLQATRDHYIPRSRGGGEGANIVLSCYRCNQDKGNTMPPDAEPSGFVNVLAAAAAAMATRRKELIARPLADIYEELAAAAFESVRNINHEL